MRAHVDFQHQQTRDEEVTLLDVTAAGKQTNKKASLII